MAFIGAFLTVGVGEVAESIYMPTLRSPHDLLIILKNLPLLLELIGHFISPLVDGDTTSILVRWQIGRVNKVLNEFIHVAVDEVEPLFLIE